MIYLDNNATTRPLPVISEIVSKYLSEEFGNPSSTSYELGRNAKAAIENARIHVSELVDCDPDEVIFTSGGTEAISLALIGRARLNKESSQILISPIEHPAVNETIKVIQDFFNLPVSKIEISRDGELDLNKIDLKNFDLISAMLANNETGIINNLDKISSASDDKIFSHVDTVQAIGKIPFSFKK